MKKVIQVVDTLNTGGAERVALDLANDLFKIGYQVFFCVTRHDGLLHQELNSNISFINLHRESSYQGLLSFRKYVKKNEIKIVHAHGNSTALFCVVSLLGINNVVIIHHDHNPLLNSRNVVMQKVLLKRVGAWIAVSQEILKWVKVNIGYVNAVMLSNPLQLSRFFRIPNEAREVKELIVLANYREQKDYENLLGAVSLLTTKNFKIRVNCFGSHSEGIYYRKIQSLVNNLNLHEVVKLNSSVMNVPEILSKSDIGILSSESEGLPISLLEYMASWLPVVVTDVGECGRIVREADCGIVVPAQNAQALAEGLAMILLREDQWEAFGRKGRRYIEKNHSHQFFLKNITDLYMKL